MPKTRAQKEELVAQYVDLLEESNGSFTVLQTQGLPVPRVQSLRNVIRNAGGLYVVAKNTLMSKALEQHGYTVPSDLLKGPTAIVFGKENFPGVMKALLEYLDKEDFPENTMTLMGGLMGGSSVFAPSQAEDISNMPTLPEIQAQIIGLLVQPSQGLVNVLQAANSGVVNVLAAADSGIINVLAAWVAKREAEEGAA